MSTSQIVNKLHKATEHAERTEDHDRGGRDGECKRELREARRAMQEAWILITQRFAGKRVGVVGRIKKGVVYITLKCSVCGSVEKVKRHVELDTVTKMMRFRCPVCVQKGEAKQGELF